MSVFCLQPGQNPKVDHARAVKEYSRSSADQVTLAVSTVFICLM